VPKTIFANANVRGVAHLQQSLDKFFCEVKEIRRSNMIFNRRLKRSLAAASKSSSSASASTSASNSACMKRILIEVMQLQKLAFTDHTAQLIKVIKQDFLNCIFSELMPPEAAVANKIRLYIGDVLELSEFRLKHVITEKELIFTCYSNNNNNNNNGNEDGEAQASSSYLGSNKRKRGLKGMAKKRRTVGFISEESTQMRSVTRSLRQIRQVKQYSQQLQ
jgi:hypothetical protein